MRTLVLPFVSVCLLVACGDEKKTETAADPMVKSATAPAPETKPMPAEFADAKYVDMGKQMMANLQSGNIDAYTEGFADNAVYLWSAGDSVAGKQAITDYWRNRRNNVIKTLQLSNDIWLPIKINQPQKGPDMPGVWLLCWNQVNVKYKTGKSLQFWTHTDYHFNDQGKIDRAVQYIDRAPVNAALGIK